MYICIHGYPYLYTSGKIDVADHRRSQYITHRQITQPATNTKAIINTNTITNPQQVKIQLQLQIQIQEVSIHQPSINHPTH